MNFSFGSFDTAIKSTSSIFKTVMCNKMFCIKINLYFIITTIFTLVNRDKLARV